MIFFNKHGQIYNGILLENDQMQIETYTFNEGKRIDNQIIILQIEPFSVFFELGEAWAIK